MKLPILTYDCDNCGECCRHAIVWGTIIDTMREPRIRTETRRVQIDGVAEDRWLLNRDPDHNGDCPCVFHDGDKCGIYNSRPNVCAGFAAGSKDCQELRQAAGLPPLQPRTEQIEEKYVICEREPSPIVQQPQDAANSTADG